jgi:Raf kinase inhibitor-like YbhB/YbcL family protein
VTTGATDNCSTNVREVAKVRFRPSIIAAALALGPLSGYAAGASPFVLFATDSRVLDHLPLKYAANTFGCTGGDISPALGWRSPPPGTRSFVLTLFDPDERSTPSGWWHWEIYDIPADTRKLALSAGAEHSSLLPQGSHEGRTDLGNLAYVGPCPAKGDPPHRYRFTLYALRVTRLPVERGASGAMVTSVAQQYVIGKAVLVVRYGR